jgi:cell division transport system permease protein
VNGLIASAIAIVLLTGCIYLAEGFVPALKVLHDNVSIALIFVGIIALGILISVLSTHRSALKYLKMKLDDLY